MALGPTSCPCAYMSRNIGCPILFPRTADSDLEGEKCVETGTYTRGHDGEIDCKVNQEQTNRALVSLPKAVADV